MHKNLTYITVLVIFVISLLLNSCAGSFQSLPLLSTPTPTQTLTPTQTPTPTPIPLTEKDPALIALQRDDLPSEFALEKSLDRIESDIWGNLPDVHEGIAKFRQVTYSAPNPIYTDEISRRIFINTIIIYNSTEHADKAHKAINLNMGGEGIELIKYDSICRGSYTVLPADNYYRLHDHYFTGAVCSIREAVVVLGYFDTKQMTSKVFEDYLGIIIERLEE